MLEGEPGSILLVEQFGESEAEAGEKVGALAGSLRRAGLGTGVLAVSDPADQEAVWTVRKAGLGLLMSMKGDAKPVSFVEDTAVPPDRLAGYMEEFLEVVREEGARCAVYGHAGAGCLQ